MLTRAEQVYVYFDQAINAEPPTARRAGRSVTLALSTARGGGEPAIENYGRKKLKIVEITHHICPIVPSPPSLQKRPSSHMEVRHTFE